MSDFFSRLTAMLKWPARRRAQRTAHEWNAKKAHILLFVAQVSGAHGRFGGTNVGDQAIGAACNLTATELSELLKELVGEGRLFPGTLPGTHSLTDWRPDPRRLFGA